MANDRDIFTSEIYVNDKQAEDAIARMTERMAKLNAEYERLKTKNGELHKHTLKKKKQHICKRCAPTIMLLNQSSAPPFQAQQRIYLYIRFCLEALFFFKVVKLER